MDIAQKVLDVLKSDKDVRCGPALMLSSMMLN